MNRAEREQRQRQGQTQAPAKPRKATAFRPKPTPARPGHYRVVTEVGALLIDGDFPSRAAARRQAVAMATYTPKESTTPLALGYRWEQLPPR